MMTDIVIPLTRSLNKDIEIRYALRSIEKHLTGYNSLFIVGYCPEWLSGAYVIPLEQKFSCSRWKDRNIMQKIVAACEDEKVSDNFLMYHDDHFLLSQYDAGSFPYYHFGKMIPSDTQYGKTKANTIAAFGSDIMNYDCHCPILFNKDKFLKTVAALKWNEPFGYCIKTAYCVMNGISGEYYDDLKIRYTKVRPEIRHQIDGRKWFSVGERSFKNTELIDVMEELYPNKSKYEMA